MCTLKGLGPQTSYPITEQQHKFKSDDGADCDSQCFEGNFASTLSEPERLNNTLSKGQSSGQIHSQDHGLCVLSATAN